MCETVNLMIANEKTVQKRPPDVEGPVSNYRYIRTTL